MENFWTDQGRRWRLEAAVKDFHEVLAERQTAMHERHENELEDEAFYIVGMFAGYLASVYGYDLETAETMAWAYHFQGAK